eukprot:TRINITY_DN708_c1_g1_i4.p1 TRINITY_DN708_c1_g1~~TRINITY_DN708_c1_g1_i4.p1  ORF type:complete len:495 (-),score=83.80 TRINITY_DN708_c1_g1_i4:6-1490(-)
MQAGLAAWLKVATAASLLPSACSQDASDSSTNTSAAPFVTTTLTASPHGSCYNPLFETSWAGKSDIRHLASEPTFQTALNLCSAWNKRLSCCTPSFEEEQQKSFDLWVHHFRVKEAHIEAFRSAMEGVRLEASYQEASKVEKLLFDKALESMKEVIRHYGTCFDTLLEYMAGVICFTCQPHWQHQVMMSPSSLRVHNLRIDDSSNELLWDSCRSLGNAGLELDHRVGDSLLAKVVKVRYEDLTMFRNQVVVSEYMEEFGLIAMRGPNQIDMGNSVGAVPTLPPTSTTFPSAPNATLVSTNPSTSDSVAAPASVQTTTTTTTTAGVDPCGTGYELDHKGWWANNVRQTLGDASIAACAEQCNTDPTCIGFSLWGYNKLPGNCYKYNNFGAPTTDDSSIACKKAAASRRLAQGAIPEPLEDEASGLLDMMFGATGGVNRPTVQPSGFITPVQDGRNSGFSCRVFPRDPVDSAGRQVASPPHVFPLLLAWAVLLPYL